jgi:alkanesulfonate monooxygenase SsuD/methylene tetrahydromethanopterin reductase-like flavin-dependent oxidoreductase (luciferase family)
MTNDADAREAVRQFMRTRDLVEARWCALAHVLIKKDPKEYEKLFEAAEKFIPFVTKLLAVGNDLHRQVYASLDDPNADWPKALLAWLNQKGPIILTKDQIAQSLQLWADEPQ